jgi:hypothetical protein
VTIGYCSYTEPPYEEPEQIELHVRHRPYEEAASRQAPADAGVDAGSFVSPNSSPADRER